MNTQAISLDVSKEPAITPVLYLGQGDKNGTIIEATIYDNGVPLTLTNYSVRFEMRLPDHTSYYRSPNGTISGNVATIPIDETYAASVDGQTCIAYVVVFSGSNTICSTNRINIIVLESAEEGADAAHAYESGIIEATAAANAAAQSANNAAANASTAATSATTAADNASTQATAAQTAASSANTAASNANQQAAAAQRNADAASTAATAATSSAESANDATTRANAAIDAMGDISELAVPLMTKDTRGGAKLGGSVQLVDERLNVKLTGGGSGRSVATETAEALAALTVHGESIQDGTPTPDAPVEVQVVEGRNLFQGFAGTVPNNPTATTNVIISGDDMVVNGTATATGYTYSNNETGYNNAPKVTLQPGTYIVHETTGLFGVRMGLAPNNAYFDVASKGDSKVITITEETTISIVPQLVNGTVFDNASPKIMVEHGNVAHEYTPYGSIGLVIGDDVTPIDLQGNVLASLPDGTHDRLLVDSAGHCVIENTVGHIASYNGESVGDVWLSSTGQLTTDADVYYKIATAQTIDLGYIDMPAIESGDAISVSASITPVIDATWWERGAGAVADAIKAIMAALEARTGELAEAIADITNG